MEPTALHMVYDISKFLIITPLIGYLFVIIPFDLPKAYRANKKLLCWVYLWLLSAGLGILVTTFSSLRL